MEEYSVTVTLESPLAVFLGPTVVFLCRTQQGFDRYRCRFPPNESSLKLIGDACSATVVLDLVYKNKTKNARYLGKKTVRNIPVKGWRLCKNETAMDYW